MRRYYQTHPSPPSHLGDTATVHRDVVRSCTVTLHADDSFLFRTGAPNNPFVSVGATTTVNTLLLLAMLAAAIPIMVNNKRRYKHAFDEVTRAPIVALTDCGFTAAVVAYEAIYTWVHRKKWGVYLAAARLGEDEFEVRGDEMEFERVGNEVQLRIRDGGVDGERRSGVSEVTLAREPRAKKDERVGSERTCGFDTPGDSGDTIRQVLLRANDSRHFNVGVLMTR